MEITVKVKDQYGRPVVHPVCKKAHLLAGIADQLDIAAIRKTLLPTNDASFKKSMVECFVDYCHTMAAAQVQASCTQMCDDHDIKWVYMSALADFADDYIRDDANWVLDVTGDFSEMRKIAKAWREEAKILAS